MSLIIYFDTYYDRYIFHQCGKMKIREGDSWRPHLFCEGNTRSVIAFSVLLAAKLGVKLDYVLFTKHAVYVRNALVWCAQGIYSKYEYLGRIYFDAAGLLEDVPDQMVVAKMDYSVIEGYRVAGYKEQPHTYAEDADEN